MKNILIITSHYPPSNLTGVHRSRHIAKFLPQFGWNPIVLTVDPESYEENLDHDLDKLLPVDQQIIRVGAFPITKPRLIGDLGLRAFFQLKKRAAQIIQTNKIDFIYILIPSFYLALLGPVLFRKFKIKYGIDYIDPWVHFFPGSDKIFSRHWFSTQLSKILEPFTVKKAALISSVSSSYIEPIFKRHPSLASTVTTVAVPYGWDKEETSLVKKMNRQTESGQEKKGSKLKLIYAGAFLPKSFEVLAAFFQSIKNNPNDFENIEFHFIGTGIRNGSRLMPTISALATKMDLYGKVIFEHPERISYTSLLNQLSNADGLFILGSTERHYTPSKLFNAFIAEKPIFAILHQDSSAISIIEETQWGIVSTYDADTSECFEHQLIDKFRIWRENCVSKSWQFNKEKAEVYSVDKLTGKLVAVLNSIV